MRSGASGLPYFRSTAGHLCAFVMQLEGQLCGGITKKRKRKKSHDVRDYAVRWIQFLKRGIKSWTKKEGMSHFHIQTALLHECMCVCEWECAYVCVSVCGSACERGHIHTSRAPSTRIYFHGRPCLAQKCEQQCQKPSLMIDLKNNIFFRIWQTWRGFRRRHALVTTRCHTCE